ncbi:hypothetical protein AURDEDRAFT_162794 [Auricularia subglabra TFB-10046 SS5]|nr:hypothetical protein AURDEDRAFT_162794 [Auricularia subglabra TFB-10046 SS5]
MNQNGNGNGLGPFYSSGVGLGQAPGQNMGPQSYSGFSFEAGTQAPGQYTPNGGPAPANTSHGSALQQGGVFETHAHSSPGPNMYTPTPQHGPHTASPSPAPQAPQPAVDETARGLAQFVESLINDSPIKFEEKQRKDLHEFATIGRNAASAGMVMLGLMNRTLMHQTVAMVTKLTTDVAALRKDVAEFKAALDATWVPTQEHKNLVRTVTKRFLIEGDRKNYTQIFKAVHEDLKDRKELLKLDDILAHDTKNKAFVKCANLVVSQTRNHFRESIQNSVGLGKQAEYEGLIAFATRMLAQFAPAEGVETVDCRSTVVMKLSILRRFTTENKDVVSSPDVGDQAEEEDPEDDTESSNGRPVKKRKKTNPQPKRGKVSTANSYFGRLEQFLADKEKQFGTSDITSKAWAPYVYDTMKTDYDTFRDPANSPDDLQAFAATIFGPAAGGTSAQAVGGSGLSNIAAHFTMPT